MKEVGKYVLITMRGTSDLLVYPYQSVKPCKITYNNDIVNPHIIFICTYCTTEYNGGINNGELLADHQSFLPQNL